MRYPRNISGDELIKKLRKLGYEPVHGRQRGSHIRIETLKNGKHRMTIPNHSQIKIGTLNNILNDVAHHFRESKDAIAKELFD